MRVYPLNKKQLHHPLVALICSRYNLNKKEYDRMFYKTEENDSKYTAG